jgi:hypothetical protein
MSPGLPKQRHVFWNDCFTFLTTLNPFSRLAILQDEILITVHIQEHMTCPNLVDLIWPDDARATNYPRQLARSMMVEITRMTNQNAWMNEQPWHHIMKRGNIEVG